MVLLWTKQMSVGNATLDSENKELIGMINSMEYVLEKRDSAALLRVYRQLMNYAHDHFASEEWFAQMIGFPFEQHRLWHQHLQKELQHTWDQLEARNGIWPEYIMDHYPQFLREWLVEHIAKEDMLMKPALQAYPYDFKPG